MLWVNLEQLLQGNPLILLLLQELFFPGAEAVQGIFMLRAGLLTVQGFKRRLVML